MSYSMTQYPNIEGEFPRPPEFLVWSEALVWDGKSRSPQGTGQVRHYPTLQKAKKHVSSYGDRPFYTNWSIYRWNADEQKYELQFSGKANEPKNDNPLFKMRVRKDDGTRELDEKAVAAALKSIAKAAK